MPEPSKSNSINTVQLFQGAINSGVSISKSGSEDEVQKELLGILKTKKLRAAIKAVDDADGPGQAASTPFEDAIGLMDKLGVNPGALAAAKDEEIKQLRAATNMADRELHEMRLREMESVERRMSQVVNDFVQKQKDITIAENSRSAGMFGGGQPGNPFEKLMYDSLVARMNPPQQRSFVEQMQELEAMDKFFRSRYAPQMPQFDPYAAYQSNNVEMFKTKSNFDIEMEKMRIQRESGDARTKALTDFAQKFIDIIPDAAAAFGEAMRQDKAKEKARDNGTSDTKAKAPASAPERPPVQTSAAANGGQQFVPHYVEGQCPYCNKIIPVPDNAPAGLKGECPYCHGLIVFEDEPEKPQEKAEKPVPPAPPQDKADEVKGEAPDA